MIELSTPMPRTTSGKTIQIGLRVTVASAKPRIKPATMVTS